MERISVVGNTGSGKTTLARQLSERLGFPLLELDSVMHQADWTPLAEDDFRQRIAIFMEENSYWIIDGNYSQVLDAVWSKADTVVWLDPPRLLIMYAVIGRTLVRLFTRRTLWNGNHESWSNLFRFNPQKSVVAWSWRCHGERRSQFQKAMGDPRWKHLVFIQLSDRKELSHWLEMLPL